MEQTTINHPKLPPNPTKFYTHFLYKAIFVSIFLLLLPLFPSQAPDFINHKTINTTSWEFLQLVFVGIAVSYGLFSKRNEESPKEDASFKHDNNNTHSYVARLLQVPSVFDEHTENSSLTESHDKVQTWSSQYYRGEPIIVVANDTDNESATIEKPLVLPVRSLKNGVGSESSMIDSKTNSFTRSNSKNISRSFRALTPEEQNSEENIVLRSPVPWRSRSGRMEVKEDCQQGVHETKTYETPSFRSPSFKSSNPVVNPENKAHHPPPGPPPPPPPPPPQRVNYTRERTNTSKDLRRNVRSVPEGYQNMGSRRLEDLTIRTKSFGTRKEYEMQKKDLLSHDKEIERFIERRGSQRKMLMDEEITHSHSKEVKKDSDENENDKEEKGGGGGLVVEDDHNGPDVDKKADEFIAKFREQIRLQRIASIRKSTAQR